MKILNPGETTVFLDDINVYVVYDKHKLPTEIEDSLATSSKKLFAAISRGLLLDVTNGVPDSLPEVKGASCQSITGKTFNPSHDALKYFREDESMSVVWTGPAADASGYANLNRRFMLGLQSSGVLVKYAPTKPYLDAEKQIVNDLMGLQLNMAPKNAPVVYGMPAQVCSDPAAYRIFLTMMETNRLHEDYVERCNQADEIIVPSNWCKQVFESSGVAKPVHVVPLGVDCLRYREGLEPLNFFQGHKPFAFLSVFQWSLRKGYDVLIKAFCEEFTTDDDVSLVISSKLYGQNDEAKGRIIKDEIKRLSGESGNPKRPPIVYFGDDVPEAVMPRLYAAADCFVLVSRGEGFGLPYIEAGACGVPVIGSRYSGQTDFLTDQNSYLVDVDSFAPNKEVELVSRFFQGMEFPVFGRQAIDQTRLHMRSVYENYEEAKKKARNLRADVELKYDWPTCVGQMKQKLNGTFRLLVAAENWQVNNEDSSSVRRQPDH